MKPGEGEVPAAFLHLSSGAAGDSRTCLTSPRRSLLQDITLHLHHTGPARLVLMLAELLEELLGLGVFHHHLGPSLLVHLQIQVHKCKQGR